MTVSISYSLIARSIVRGLEPSWIKACYGLALKPDAVFYLRSNVGGLIPRVLSSPAGFDYWESGQDYLPSPDVYNNFVEHQTRLLAEFRRLAEQHGFTTVDARGPVPDVFRALAEVIEPVVQVMATFDHVSANGGVVAMPHL